MTARKPHPDNALIDEMERDGPVPSQGGTSGGNVQRSVGARAEEHGATREPGVERARSQDNPRDAEMKGAKSIEWLDSVKRGPTTSRP